ncbi:hypothetical protein Vadar_027812 [Vaccinium darrowii]|uniref:Uncharacterized protein n=1 Tax=Vaccinium darrowii TaxID=229202 RepID=A0ACB7YYV5_9ERIC|nr:hypothetical protein Vadar_027812 [Vaccinium darrowii]
MIRTHKLGLVGVVEAKFQLENVDKTVRRCFPAQWSYAHNGIPSRVARTLVGWDSQLLKVDVIGQNLIGDRRSLWGEMISLASSIGYTPWIQIGDFNVVRRRSERVLGFDVGVAAEFNTCLDSIDMDDMPSKGMWFTWSNKRGGLGDVKSQLDRTLSNSSWMDSFPESETTFLPLRVSDHCFIWVDILSSFPRRIPFKFFNYWMKHVQFKSEV